jgi:hypothetical protein
MSNQKAGTAATLAIIIAIASFFVTFAGNPVWGLLIAVLAVILGIIGVVSSVSPKVGGGLVSIIAIILGVLDIGVAILGIIGVIIF